MLSDYLNELLDMDGGEDFEKLAEEPRAEHVEAEESDICKTDRKAICSHLDWMCRYLQNEKGLTTVGENKIRLLKKLIAKLS